MRKIITVLIVLVGLTSCDSNESTEVENRELSNITGFINASISPESFYKSSECTNGQDAIPSLEVRYITKLPVEDYGSTKEQVLAIRDKYFNRVFSSDLCKKIVFIIPKEIDITFDVTSNKYKEVWKIDPRFYEESVDSKRPESTNDGLDLDGDLDF